MAGSSTETNTINEPEPIGFWELRLDRGFSDDRLTVGQLRNSDKRDMDLVFSSHVTFKNGEPFPQLLSDEQLCQIAHDAFKEMEKGWEFWNFDKFLTRDQRAQVMTQKNTVMTVLAVDQELYLSSSAKGPDFEYIKTSKRVSDLLANFRDLGYAGKPNQTHRYEGKCGEVFVINQFDVKYGPSRSILKNSRVISVGKRWWFDGKIVIKEPCGVSHPKSYFIWKFKRLLITVKQFANIGNADWRTKVGLLRILETLWYSLCESRTWKSPPTVC